MNKVISKLKTKEYLFLLTDVLSEDVIKKLSSSKEVLSATQKIINKSYGSLTDLELGMFCKEIVLPLVYGDVSTQDNFLILQCKTLAERLTREELNDLVRFTESI